MEKNSIEKCLGTRNFLVFDTPNHRFGTQTDKNFLSKIRVILVFIYMKKKQIHTRKELQALRRSLRSNATPAEAFLWKRIKSKQLDGRRFQRQHSIKHYIVDFYCASEKLIIELDGQVHYTPKAIEKDTIRK